MDRLNDLLKRNIQGHKLEEHFIAHEVLRSCVALITEHMPARAASAVKPTAFQHGVIFLSARNNAAAQEFRFYSEKILKELQKKHPKEDVRRFSFRLQEPSLDSNGDEVAL